MNFPEVSLPSGAPSTTEYLGSAWVGIDGDTCQSSEYCTHVRVLLAQLLLTDFTVAILQTGIYWILEGTQTDFFAWYEWYPGPVQMFNISANPGDIFSLSVVAHNATSGTVSISNESTGQNVSATLNDQPALCLENVSSLPPTQNMRIMNQDAKPQHCRQNGLSKIMPCNPLQFSPPSLSLTPHGRRTGLLATLLVQPSRTSSKTITP